MPRRPAHAAPDPPQGPRDVPTDYFDDAWTEIYPEHALSRDTARALLTAAERLGYDPGRAVVSVSGGYRVPADVLDAADIPTEPRPVEQPFVATPLAALDQGAIPDPDRDPDDDGSTDAGS